MIRKNVYVAAAVNGVGSHHAAAGQRKRAAAAAAATDASVNRGST